MADTPQQFAARIKAKFPEYQGVADDVLVGKILAKHPEYRSRVDLGAGAAEYGPSSRQNFPAQSNAVDYEAAERNAAKPSIVSDPKGWWRGLSDDEKQAVLDNVGEFAGGTLGAMAGEGVASIPGAGAGATAGKSIARLAGKVGGLKTTPRTGKEALSDMATTFATNAVGEGVGRLAPLVTHAGMTGAENALRKNLVDPGAQEIARLAEAQGVPVTPGMLSRTGQKVTGALERFPTSEGVIREAKMNAQRPWEGNLERMASEYFPRPVSSIETGAAQRQGLEANRGAARDYFGRRYEGLNRLAGDAPIAMDPTQGAASALLESIPEEASRAFPANTLRKIQQLSRLGGGGEHEAVAKSLTGRAFADLDQEQQKRVFDTMRAMGMSPEPPMPVMTFREAQSLRTQLLEAERGLQRSAPALDRQAIPRLRASIDTAIEQSLGSSKVPEHTAALAEWRDLNQQFRGMRQKLDKPSRPGKPGNAAAGIIDSENNLERLPQRLTSSETPFNQAEVASSRATTRPLQPPVGGAASLPPAPPLMRPSVNVDPGPPDMLRRHFADDLVNRSRLNDRGLEDVPSVSPRKLETNIRKEPETINTVLGPDAYQKYQEAVQVGKAFNPRDVNPSGTAGTSETIREAKKAAAAAAAVGGIGGALLGSGDLGERTEKGLGAAATFGIGMMAPRVLAKQFVKPEFAQRLLSPAEKALQMRYFGGPMAGGIGRGIAMGTEEPPLPEFARGGVVKGPPNMQRSKSLPKIPNMERTK